MLFLFPFFLLFPISSCMNVAIYARQLWWTCCWERGALFFLFLNLLPPVFPLSSVFIFLVPLYAVFSFLCFVSSIQRQGNVNSLKKGRGKKKKTTACQPKINELCFFFSVFFPCFSLLFLQWASSCFLFFFFVLFCPFFPFFGLHQPRNGQSPAFFFFVELLVAASFECHSALLSLCFFFFF